MAKAAVSRLPIDAVPHPGREIRCDNCNMKIQQKAFMLVLKIGSRYFCRLGCANGDLKGQKSLDEAL